MSLNKIPLPGYSCAKPKPGYTWAGDLFGNNNYQAGGDTIYATDVGLSGIETVNFTFGGNSSSGTYVAKAHQSNNNYSNANEGFASAFSKVTIQWYYAANSVEVANNTNLNADSVRVEFNGV